MSVKEIVEGLTDRMNAGDKDDIDQVAYNSASSVILKVAGAIINICFVFIILVVPLIISLEIVYLCFPFIREKVEEYLVKVESNGRRARMLGFSLQDARKAVEIAETQKTGQSAMRIYLINKVKSHMFMAYILAWVIRGAPTLIQTIARLTSGVLVVVREALENIPQ